MHWWPKTDQLTVKFSNWLRLGGKEAYNYGIFPFIFHGNSHYRIYSETCTFYDYFLVTTNSVMSRVISITMYIHLSKKTNAESLLCRNQIPKVEIHFFFTGIHSFHELRETCVSYYFLGHHEFGGDMMLQVLLFDLLYNHVYASVRVKPRDRKSVV